MNQEFKNINKSDYGLYDEDINNKLKPSKQKNVEDDDMKIFSEIEYGVDIKDSIIYLHGDIQLGNLFDFISKVRIILSNRPEDKKQDPINLMLNTNGGDVYEALGIIDYIESLEVPVNIIARGRAMSAGAMILCCGTGIRAASKSTTIMVHEASAEIFGKSADIKANAEHIDELEEDFYKIMAIKTKQDEEFWRKACRKDYYMSAEKAKELGLIDEIV
jgi:ATP-dependent Clp endopeptidase proteolytic subunit ClpP